MLEKDHSGFTTIYCDGELCAEKFEHDGWGAVDIIGAVEKARDEGWRIKRVDGEWIHFCPECVRTGNIE
jgi:hypothetical protein